MLDFFNALDSYSKFYLIIAIIGTIAFLGKLLFIYIDGDIDFDQDNAFTFLSTQSILAFQMGSGWIGLAAKTEWQLGNLHSIIASVIAGFLTMFLMTFLMMQVKKLNKINNVNINNCKGTAGNAYTKFAPNGSGQIQIDLNGKLQTLNAINCTDEEIPSFSSVIVTGVKDSTILIAKHKQED